MLRMRRTIGRNVQGEVWIERKELTGSERREYKRLGARKTKKETDCFGARTAA